MHRHLSFRAGTIGQVVADVLSGPSLTPCQETRNNCSSLTFAFLKFEHTSKRYESLQYYSKEWIRFLQFSPLKHLLFCGETQRYLFAKGFEG